MRLACLVAGNGSVPRLASARELAAVPEDSGIRGEFRGEGIPGRGFQSR